MTPDAKPAATSGSRRLRPAAPTAEPASVSSAPQTAPLQPSVVAGSAPLGLLFKGGAAEGMTTQQRGQPAPFARMVDKAVGVSAFASAFQTHVSPSALDVLKQSMADTPVVLVAGQQCTGKGTVAPLVARALAGDGAITLGTGSLMREAAKNAGMTIEQFAPTVPPTFDVTLDHRAATLIAEGKVTTFESRLAGHLGQFLRAMGRKNLVTVYLTASPKEQALRYVAREVSAEARARIERKIALPKRASLRDALEAIVRTGDQPIVDKIGPLVDKIAGRDEIDRRRLLELYGVDYQDASAFDVVVSTDNKTPATVLREILDAVKANLAA